MAPFPRPAEVSLRMEWRDREALGRVAAAPASEAGLAVAGGGGTFATARRFRD